MEKLKPCPFCGSKNLHHEMKVNRIKYNGLDMRVEQRTYSVRCNKCHARGGTAGGKVIPYWNYNENPFTGEPLDDRGIFELPDWATTDSVLWKKSTEAWNRRADEECPAKDYCDDYIFAEEGVLGGKDGCRKGEQELR